MIPVAPGISVQVLIIPRLVAAYCHSCSQKVENHVLISHVLIVFQIDLLLS